MQGFPRIAFHLVPDQPFDSNSPRVPRGDLSHTGVTPCTDCPV